MQTLDNNAVGATLSRLIDAAAAGEEIIFARAGKPMARLVALSAEPTAKRRVLGPLNGRFNVPADFDTTLPDDNLDAIEGR